MNTSTTNTLLVGVTASAWLFASSVAAAEKPQDYDEALPNCKIEMVGVAGGSYRQRGYFPGERSLHALTRHSSETHVSSFWIAKFETRFSAYQNWQMEGDSRRTFKNDSERRAHAAFFAHGKPNTSFMNPYGFNTPNFPVVGVHQWTAKRYCHWLSMRTGKFYRLPTEAEWEFACLAGEKMAPFPWGYETEELSKYAVVGSGDETVCELAQVGTKKPNAWGIYDMIGNAEEWVADGYEENRWGGQKTDPITWPASRQLSQDPQLAWAAFKAAGHHYCEGWGVTKGGSWHYARCRDPICFSIAARGNPFPLENLQIPRRYNQDEPCDFDGDSCGTAYGFRVARPVVVPERKIQLWHWGIYFDHDKWLHLTLEPTAEMK